MSGLGVLGNSDGLVLEEFWFFGKAVAGAFVCASVRVVVTGECFTFITENEFSLTVSVYFCLSFSLSQSLPLLCACVSLSLSCIFVSVVVVVVVTR